MYFFHLGLVIFQKKQATMKNKKLSMIWQKIENKFLTYERNISCDMIASKARAIAHTYTFSSQISIDRNSIDKRNDAFATSLKFSFWSCHQDSFPGGMILFVKMLTWTCIV